MNHCIACVNIPDVAIVEIRNPDSLALFRDGRTGPGFRRDVPRHSRGCTPVFTGMFCPKRVV